MTQRDTTTELTILVAPLDWGLGHATRCIPLIHVLLQHKCKVILAGEGKIRNLLKAEFPQLEWLHLPGYKIRYSAQRWLMPFQMMAQAPRLLSHIQKEQMWLQKVAGQRKIDAVISDNRYGLYHSSVNSVLITHQLRIQSFLGKGTDDLLQKIHYRLINRFAACWVPDAAADGLGGVLSHPPALPQIPTHYLGALSRFKKDKEVPEKQHLLVLLSGPEPQRTILEDLLLDQVKIFKKKVVWVRGLPDDTVVPLQVPPFVEVHNHLTTKVLQQKMLEANFIISRCGYSTVMDVATLQQKAIYIPTPGQTEQEYLAKELMNAKKALCIQQSHFQLLPALELAATFPYCFPLLQRNDLHDFLGKWVNGLRQSISSSTPNPKL